MAHARRKVFDAREQQPALSSQVLALVRALYDVEDRARPLDDAGRLALRQQESVPLMAQSPRREPGVPPIHGPKVAALRAAPVTPQHAPRAAEQF